MEPWKGCGLFIVILVILSRKYFILLYDSWIPSILQISLKTLWNLIEFKGPEVFWQSGLSKSHAIKRFQVTSINWNWIRWYTDRCVGCILDKSSKYKVHIQYREYTEENIFNLNIVHRSIHMCLCQCIRLSPWYPF